MPYKTTKLWGLFSILLLLGMAACRGDSAGTPTAGTTASPASTTPVAEGLQVELDIFSGMPNPAWRLSVEETEQFLTLASALPPSSEQAFPEPLGYRGFVLRGMDAAGEEARWRVSEGAVEISNSQAVSFVTDTDRQLEKWLLQSGRTQIAADLYRMLAEQFEVN